MTVVLNILGAIPNPITHIVDEPWHIHGRKIPWMSAHIAVMILAALLLAISMTALARKHVPHARRHSMGLIELIVLFVRMQIARPTLGPAADKAVPFLATLFMFLLLNNLLGMVPLLELSEAIGLHSWGRGNSTMIGGTPTSGVWVCVAFAAMTLLGVIFTSYFRQVLVLWKGSAISIHESGHGEHQPPAPARQNVWLGLARLIRRRRWPLPVAAVLGVWTWLNDFVPPIPGIVGLVMWPVLLVIELIGYVAKCFALCVRLLANMNSGHILLAVLLIFAETARGWMILPVSIPAAIGVLLLAVLELLVAVLQAYIFTFLSALFIGLATSPQH